MTPRVKIESRGERLANAETAADNDLVANLEDEELSFDDVMAPIFTLERGQRLSLVRRSMNLNQAELALKLGLTQKALSRIETGGAPYCSTDLTATLLRNAIHTSGIRYVMFGRQGYQYEKPNALDDWKERTKNPGNRTPGHERFMSTHWAQGIANDYLRKWEADLVAGGGKRTSGNYKKARIEARKLVAERMRIEDEKRGRGKDD